MKLARLGWLSLAVWAAGARAAAQTPGDLGIQTYAGITLTGVVGTVYSIEYAADLAHTNDPPTNARRRRVFAHSCVPGGPRSPRTARRLPRRNDRLLPTHPTAQRKRKHERIQSHFALRVSFN